MPTLSLTASQRRRAAAVLVCVLVALLAWRHHDRSTPAAASLRVAPVRGASAGRARGAAPAPALVVDVVGAVRRPGLYRLPKGARVADAVSRAGGLTPHAERAAVNLAAPVSDGEQVSIAARGSPAVASGVPAAAGSAAPAGSPSAPVSLSTATPDQLDTLPGVGPVTAQKIVVYRQQHGPFTSVDELDAIPGIGPARLRDLQGLVVP